MSPIASNVFSQESSRSQASAEARQPGPCPIRVLCVDDHPTIRMGIGAVINRQTDMELLGAAHTASEGIHMFRELQPDVTLMDLRFPDLDGIEALTVIRSEFPKARVLILTTYDGEFDIFRALRAGAAGYLLKSVPKADLLAAIRNVYQGHKSLPHEVTAQVVEHLDVEALSHREVEVLRRLADGNRNKGIAQTLFISEETVKAHIKRIMEKLGATDRTHAFAIAIRRGIIQI